MADAFKTMQDLLHQTQGTVMLCVTDLPEPNGDCFHYIYAQVAPRQFVVYQFIKETRIDSRHNTLFSISIKRDCSIWDLFERVVTEIGEKNPYAVLTFYTC